MSSDIYGLILASGISSRFGTKNKLTSDVAGTSVIARTVEAYLAVLPRTIVVVGHLGDAVQRSLASLAVRIVWNTDYADGQSTSLRAGLASLPLDVRAVVIGVGDQPLLLSTTITKLIETFDRYESQIVVPYYGRNPGNPVLFGRSMFAELMEVKGDVGGRPVIARHSVARVTISEWWTALDVDHPEDAGLAERYLVCPPGVHEMQASVGKRVQSA